MLAPEKAFLFNQMCECRVWSARTNAWVQDKSTRIAMTHEELQFFERRQASQESGLPPCNCSVKRVRLTHDDPDAAKLLALRMSSPSQGHAEQEAVIRDAIDRGRLVQRQVKLWDTRMHIANDHAVTKDMYNKLRLSLPFLSKVVAETNAARILFFERDSVACAASPLSLSHFSMRWDYAGGALSACCHRRACSRAHTLPCRPFPS